MESHRLLSEKERKEIWDFFYDRFLFSPSIHSLNWPSIASDKISFKIDIKNLFGDTYNEVVWDDFEAKAINAFQLISPDDYIYALDWQHDCYFVSPAKFDDFKKDLEAKNNNYISFIPNGDYYIFITKDLKNIWFGHPWEKTVTLFGDKFIKEFIESNPLFLKKV